jgi:hypothetical protein
MQLTTTTSSSVLAMSSGTLVQQAELRHISNSSSGRIVFACVTSAMFLSTDQ